MKNLNITNEELRAIDIFLNTNPCKSGCAYPEMETSKKDCDECELIKSRDTLLKKLNLL